MCTINITLNDALVKKARLNFADDEALQQWAQQVVVALLEYYSSSKAQPSMGEDEQAIPDVVLSLLGAGLPIADDDLNGRASFYKYLEEKYK